MTLLRQNISSEVRTLFKEISVTRKPKIGVMARDRSNSDKFSWPRFQEPYIINFPSVRLHLVNDVTVIDEYIAIHESGPILDHHIVPLFNPEGQLTIPATIKDRLALAVSNRDQLERVDADDLPTLVVHNEGGGTWGHWIVQALPKVILFKQIFPDGKIALPRGYLGPKNNFGLSLEIFGITRNSIVPLEPSKAVYFPQAVFIDHLYHNEAVHPAAVELLAGARIPATSEHRDRIFIDRTTNSTTRNIVNLEEIHAVSESLGFHSSNLGSLSVKEQGSAWRAGTSFLSVLGSDFTNIVFGRPQSEIYSITPDFHGDMFFFDLAAAKGILWHELLCGHIVEKRDPVRHSSFSVDPDCFKKFLSTGLGSQA